VSPRARGPAAAPVRPETSGLLLVDKPAGPTSHDVVLRVRRALAAPGAGHLGTLDPPATGLLIVAVGAATRCVPLLQSGNKTYEVTIRFGVETETEDLTGAVTRTAPVEAGEAGIRAAASRLLGEQSQIPPMVSAIRVGGERLHRLARRGAVVERAPRPVHVFAWDWLEFALPDARARITCSPGTYVRSLARDLGRDLGCGAVVATLRRLRSEPYGLERAVTDEDLRTLDAAALWAKGGVPLGEALRSYPSVVVDDAEKTALGDGRALSRPAPAPGEAAAMVVLRDAADVPLAIAARAAGGAESGGRIEPRIVFPWTVRKGAA